MTLSAVSFESDSQLRRVESLAFSWSLLKSIVIPRGVTFIDGSAFLHLSDLSVSVEPGDSMFSVDDHFLFNFSQTMIVRYFGSASSVVIPRCVEVLCAWCFASCSSVLEIVWESGSQLKHIERQAFEGAQFLCVSIPSRECFIAPDAFPPCCVLSFAGDAFYI
jgi:hypothetical protein